MTWGVVTTNEKPEQQKENLKSVTGQVPAMQAAPAAPAPQPSAKLFAGKKVYITACVMLVCGLLCILFGVCKEIAMFKMTGKFHGFGIWAGVLFAIAGTVAILAHNKPTSRRLAASTVFSILVILCSLLVIGGFAYCMVREHREHGRRSFGEDGLRAPKGRSREEGRSSEEGKSSAEKFEKLKKAMGEGWKKSFEKNWHHHHFWWKKNCTWDQKHQRWNKPERRNTRDIEMRRHHGLMPIMMFVSSIVVVVLTLVQFGTGIALFAFALKSLKQDSYSPAPERYVVPIPAGEKKFLADMNDLPKMKPDDQVV